MDEKPTELDQLRDDYPAWTFGTVWASANSGPDVRRVWAKLAGQPYSLVTAWTAAELRLRIDEIEK